MKPIRKPFFMVNPKSYLCGKKLLNLALAADAAAMGKDFDVFFTAPFVDITRIAENTQNLIVTAQHMDSIKMGRGMGHIVPEMLVGAGARAVFLNHAENSLKLVDLVQTMERAKEVGLYTIVCADSIDEAKAIAELKPDILLCEPTDLIGKATISPTSYIQQTIQQIKAINPDILVMQAAGIRTGEDVYHVIMEGAEGTGCTSGIVCADNPQAMLREMIDAVEKAGKAGGK